MTQGGDPPTFNDRLSAFNLSNQFETVEPTLELSMALEPASYSEIFVLKNTNYVSILFENHQHFK